MLNRSQKLLAYYQMVSSVLITGGAVSIALWFTVTTGGISTKEDWFIYEGAGLLTAGVSLVVLGIVVPACLIRKIPESGKPE